VDVMGALRRKVVSRLIMNGLDGVSKSTSIWNQIFDIKSVTNVKIW